MVQTVLIVDDHEPTVNLIRDALTSHGYAVISAKNGAECLVAVDNEWPDLIILDVNLPILNGFDVLRMLRCDLNEKELPVVMLSGRGHFSDVRTGYKDGADIYLTKPVRVGALIAAVRWLTRERCEEDSDSSPTHNPAPKERELLGNIIGRD